MGRLFVVGLFLASQVGHALELRVGSGFLQLPASSFHHLAYQFDLGVGKSSQWRLGIGMAHPFFRSGLRQIIANGAIGYEWADHDRGLRPFGGLGLGVYVDQVGTRIGTVPSLNLRAGIKVGGSNLGAAFTLDTYVGVYNFSQVTAWTLWPLYQFILGVYLAT